jgi:hypothetical protein
MMMVVFCIKLAESFFYADDDHLTDAGSDLVKHIFEKAILESDIKNSQTTNSK